jgi:hypothetical protein
MILHALIMKNILRIFLAAPKGIYFLAFCVLLVACLPEDDKSTNVDNVELVQGRLDGHLLFIPEPYFARGLKDFSDGTITLEVEYPSLQPLVKTPQQMWEQGEKWKHIRILIQEIQSTQSIAKSIEERIEFFKAYEIVGNEYGLVHRTQPKEYIQDKWDIWVEQENGSDLSYITCTEKLSPISVPQCTHHIKTDNFYITLHYNKKLLPNWRFISEGFLATMDSFRGGTTAKVVPVVRTEFPLR